MSALRIGIEGVGKIAREQHIPAIRANGAYRLVATANGQPIAGAAHFPTMAAMLEADPGLDAVAICSPPQAHYVAARQALAHGKHVLLEKPPCETQAQLEELAGLARSKGVTLFQTWHARHADAVDTAATVLKDCAITQARVEWKEDVDQCHPGQKWLWDDGGFGVFDAGINALSILTTIIPGVLWVRSAALSIPENCRTPVAAEVILQSNHGARIEASFDFRHKGAPIWNMDFVTDRGAVKLGTYGSSLTVGGKLVPVAHGDGEYPVLYRRFAELAAEGRSEVDERPFRLLATILQIGVRTLVEPFHWSR
ncbi:MAG: Gfo/Idh/MocA family oxidoreductase [Alphaproteobacteria bacterium]|nr:Gfo/Idh/MocA family oxidoreductase [Alphaproteobacteria bacterium]